MSNLPRLDCNRKLRERILVTTTDLILRRVNFIYARTPHIASTEISCINGGSIIVNIIFMYRTGMFFEMLKKKQSSEE